jgi:hypothetical protein
MRCTSGLGGAAAPFTAAVARALEKMNPRGRGQRLDLVDGEFERTIDEAVNRQRVHGRIEIRARPNDAVRSATTKA